jgi:class 3 adenylate cyclase
VPTLVICRALPERAIAMTAPYVAEHIPTARLVRLDGNDAIPVLGDREPMQDEIRRFLQDVEEGVSEEPDRVLATVLFTDIVGSTAKAAELGDRAWRELLAAHHGRIRRELSRFRGREVDTAGDGFFATFDGPARAIRAACAATESVRDLGVEIRAGLHTGECEIHEGKVGGIAVHIGARVSAEAGPNEVLVSSTVRDLVAGSGIGFVDRGTAELKGVPGEWRLYAVER